jgi:hypothetical protein
VHCCHGDERPECPILETLADEGGGDPPKAIATPAFASATTDRRPLLVRSRRFEEALVTPPPSVASPTAALERPAPPTFAEALGYWLKLGFISFGGPAGQIALMHQELVERRRWISEGRFLHALNYCMVLPGPEAQQLATYIGWLMHRTWGGLAAGGLFVLPSLAILIALAWIYMAHGDVPAVAALSLRRQACRDRDRRVRGLPHRRTHLAEPLALGHRNRRVRRHVPVAAAVSADHRRRRRGRRRRLAPGACGLCRARLDTPPRHRRPARRGSTTAARRRPMRASRGLAACGSAPFASACGRRRLRCWRGTFGWSAVLTQMAVFFRRRRC